MIASEGFSPLEVGAGSFLWTLVIFGVSLPLMWKLVFSRIAAMATERDALASEAILAAEKANQDAEQVRAEVEVRLGEAQAEAAKLLAGARERAEVRERDIVDNAKKEAEAMIASARTTIESEKDKALAAIRTEVVGLTGSRTQREFRGRSAHGARTRWGPGPCGRRSGPCGRR